MIEDYQTGEECDLGVNGKILVKGDMVMKGYFNDFEETSLHIRHGWYDTGDMGNLDEDGYLWHVGRLKRFVKIGGEMVSLIRVENALENYIPDDLPPVSGDFKKLQQAFLNLFLNSLHVMPDGGLIHLEACAPSRPEEKLWLDDRLDSVSHRVPAWIVGLFGFYTEQSAR